jgi:hypothetical protein
LGIASRQWRRISRRAGLPAARERPTTIIIPDLRGPLLQLDRPPENC